MKAQRLTRFFLQQGYLSCTISDPTDSGFMEMEIEGDTEYSTEIFATDTEGTVHEVESVRVCLHKSDLQQLIDFYTVPGARLVLGAAAAAGLQERIAELEEENRQLKEELEKESAVQCSRCQRRRTMRKAGETATIGRPPNTQGHCGLCREPGHNRRTCPTHSKGFSALDFE